MTSNTDTTSEDLFSHGHVYQPGVLCDGHQRKATKECFEFLFRSINHLTRHVKKKHKKTYLRSSLTPPPADAHWGWCRELRVKEVQIYWTSSVSHRAIPHLYWLSDQCYALFSLATISLSTQVHTLTNTLQLWEMFLITFFPPQTVKSIWGDSLWREIAIMWKGLMVSGMKGKRHNASYCWSCNSKHRFQKNMCAFVPQIIIHCIIYTANVWKLIITSLAKAVTPLRVTQV